MSPRCSEEYVTRKITKGAASIAKGQQQGLTLGNLDIQIDFGFAGEYMEAAWQIMQLDESDDFIIATGETHSLEEVVDVAFAKIGLDYKGYVKFDSRFARPEKTSGLAGDASKARKLFGFKPRVRFKEIIEAMVAYDLGQ